MAQSSRSRSDRPAKPYEGFPLFPHATRRWAKKIKGKFVFFGPWEDPHGALERFMAQRDFLLSPAPARARPVPVRRPAPVLAVNPRRDDELGLAEGLLDQNTNVLAGSSPTRPSLVTTGRTLRRSVATTAPVHTGDLTVRDLVNHFLTAKRRRVESSEMGLRSFSEYHTTAGKLVKLLGKDRIVTALTPDDFSNLRAALALRRGPLALGNEIGRVRSIFKHGFEAGLFEHPMRFGPDFSKPNRRAVRLARWASRGGRGGVKMFEPAEIKTLLDAAGVQMRAMILLGLNCGMGNTDVSELPRTAVDLKAGVIDFPRPKTAIERRAVLWPETVEALRQVLKARPKPKSKEDDGQVFLTRFGYRWVRVQEPGERSTGRLQAVVTDSVALEFGKLIRSVGLAGLGGGGGGGEDGTSAHVGATSRGNGDPSERPGRVAGANVGARGATGGKRAAAGKRGRGFYALRHTFRTVADEVGDRPAIDLIMGHQDGADIANHYIERISDERLRKVVEHVRSWAKVTDQ
ncbi:MAG: hypothetical protein AB7G11_17380 [Phycisphaerales bacterium]